MLTNKELSQETRNRIIEILDRDGVNLDSVQACVMGVAINNLGLTPEEAMGNKFPELVKNTRENNVQYCEQVLTVYGVYHADKTVNMLEALTGYRIPDERSAEVIQKTVDKFLPLVILKPTTVN